MSGQECVALRMLIFLEFDRKADYVISSGSSRMGVSLRMTGFHQKASCGPCSRRSGENTFLKTLVLTQRTCCFANTEHPDASDHQDSSEFYPKSDCYPKQSTPKMLLWKSHLAIHQIVTNSKASVLAFPI